ncbi:MAG: TrkH family potassium uptake protein [Vicinamibacterales bacterium]
MPRRRRQLSPPQLLALSISALIALGSLLLWLPVSAPAGRSLSLVDAFFTATSAVCVTGLVVVDTPHDLSMFGQAVVLVLIQLGGLGYMTISTVLAAAFGRAITLQERLTLQEALNVHDLEGLVRFAGTVLKLTLFFELTGATILAVRWWGELGPSQAMWYGLFHAVSAFNNAGFALWSDSLIGWQTDLTVNGVISALIIFGGLGFFVMNELMRLRSRVTMSLHTRLALTSTAALIVLGMVAILSLEWHNPGTLGRLPLGDRLLAAWFQSVTARTAGFNTVNIAALTPPTLFLMMALMFIGASPGGTGGGVKTTTFSVTVAALWATVRGDDEPVMFGRRISDDTVARAFFVSLIAFLALNGAAGVLLIAESRPFMETLFETTSAFGTVGLSTGMPGTALSLVGGFGAIGKVLIVGLMFMGRVGPLTLAFALARRGSLKARIRYPEGKVLIG